MVASLDHGGVVLVQNPDEAEFPGMPRSAMDAGVADRILAPRAMPAAIRDQVLPFSRSLCAQAGVSFDDANNDGIIDFDDLEEAVKMAMRSLRANKFRSALTLLGVMIGVSTVMAMASIVEGIRAQIVRTPGGSSALMPFYGVSPDEAAEHLSAWLTRAAQLVPAGPAGPAPR